MKISAVSDIHGKLSHSIPDCDVLCLAGDYPPLWSTAEAWQSARELEWVRTKFLRWLKRQPFDRCLVGWGNHDLFAMDPMTGDDAVMMLQSIPGVVVLGVDNPSVVIDGVRFSSYPFTPTIQQRDWAYSQPRGSRSVPIAVDHCIHPNTDVLISHGPPQGFLDRVEDRNTGCAILASKIVDVSPTLVLCGHIHEQRGNREFMWNARGKQSRIVNVSMCDRECSERGAKIQTYYLG